MFYFPLGRNWPFECQKRKFAFYSADYSDNEDDGTANPGKMDKERRQILWDIIVKESLGAANQRLYDVQRRTWQTIKSKKTKALIQKMFLKRERGMSNASPTLILWQDVFQKRAWNV